MGRRILIATSLVIGLAALWYYFNLQPSHGIETLSGDDNKTVQWLTLGTAVVSLLTAVVSLGQEIFKARTRREGS